MTQQQLDNIVRQVLTILGFVLPLLGLQFDFAPITDAIILVAGGIYQIILFFSAKNNPIAEEEVQVQSIGSTSRAIGRVLGMKYKNAA